MTLLEDEHALAALTDDGEIVRDEQQGGAEVAAEVIKKVEQLRLQRDVERGGRLVGDDHFGLEHQRQCEQHALALATREFVRKASSAARGIADADAVEHGDRAFRSLGAARDAVCLKCRGELPPDAHGGIERAQRLLEDHRDAPAADLTHRIRSERGELQIAKHDARGWRST